MATSKVLRLKFLIQMVFQLVKEHQRLVQADSAIISYWTEAGKQVEIDTSLITQAGTAKIQVESKIEVTCSKNEMMTITATLHQLLLKKN